MNDVDEASRARERAGPRGVSPLRVALLSNRTLCTACLRILLRECDEQIDTVELRAAVDWTATTGIGVGLQTLFSPQPSDLSNVAKAVQALGSIPLVVLVDHGDPEIVNHLLALGVRGVLSFDLDAPVVAAALRLVNAGGVYVPPWPGGRTAPDAPTARGTSAATAQGRLARLSPRERAVLHLLQQSLSNREIAGALGIAEATVKIHVRNLLRKTQARNRVELALLAARNSFQI